MGRVLSFEKSLFQDADVILFAEGNTVGRARREWLTGPA